MQQVLISSWKISPRWAPRCRRSLIHHPKKCQVTWNRRIFSQVFICGTFFPLLKLSQHPSSQTLKTWYLYLHLANFYVVNVVYTWSLWARVSWTTNNWRSLQTYPNFPQKLPGIFMRHAFLQEKFPNIQKSKTTSTIRGGGILGHKKGELLGGSPHLGSG